MYVAPGGGPLHIFLEQATPITDEVAQLFEAKAHEYMERVSPTAHLYTDKCGGHTGDERKDCFNSFLGPPFLAGVRGATAWGIFSIMRCRYRKTMRTL